MADVVLYFASNADAMIATKTLKDAGVASKMIPRPANVNSQANLCLAVDATAESPAKAALSAGGIALGGVVAA